MDFVDRAGLKARPRNAADHPPLAVAKFLVSRLVHELVEEIEAHGRTGHAVAVVIVLVNADLVVGSALWSVQVDVLRSSSIGVVEL